MQQDRTDNIKIITLTEPRQKFFFTSRNCIMHLIFQIKYLRVALSRELSIYFLECSMCVFFRTTVTEA